MADTPTTTETFTVTGDVPLFSDPFAMDSWGLTDYLGGLSLNEYAQKQAEYAATAAPIVAPLAPELLPEVLVTAAKTVTKAVTSQLTPAGIALSFFTPTPIASQDQENILLDQYNAWKGFYAGLDIGTPALPQSPALPASTETPAVVALPEFTVSPPAPQLPSRTIFPPELIVPFLTDFAPQPLDAPIPPEVFPEEAPPAPPPGRAAPVPGAVPIGLPVGGSIVLPQEIPWWENVPAIATPTPLPPETGIPPLVLFPSVPNDRPITGIVDPVVSLSPGLDLAADRPRGIVGDFVANPPIISIGTDVPGIVAVPLADTVRPAELAPAVDVGTDFLSGFAQPLPFASPLDGTSSVAPPRVGTRDKTDECECAKAKKKRKKPTDRAVCYRGTYRQNKRGITYNRLEEIPCEAKQKSKAAPRKKSGRTPTWQDTLNDVFNTPKG